MTRQELLFFDGGMPWQASGVPGWCDYERSRYGTSDIDTLGIKAAIDDEGPLLDPDADLPTTTDTEPHVRAYLRELFPALADAPLVGARSCRYALTPDTRLIAAAHPDHSNVWLVGGGSGTASSMGCRWRSGSQAHSPPERLSLQTSGWAPGRAHAVCERRARALHPTDRCLVALEDSDLWPLPVKERCNAPIGTFAGQGDSRSSQWPVPFGAIVGAFAAAAE